MNSEDLFTHDEVEGVCMSFFVKVFLSWAQTVSPVTRQEQITDWYLEDKMLLDAWLLLKDPAVQGVVPPLNLACFDYSDSSSVVWSL